MPRIAVVGSGISGLAAAWELSAADTGISATLFEAGRHFGGHANTVDLTLDGVAFGVDTGFLVYNERTYPRLLALFAQLGVERAESEMSFSVQCPDPDGGAGLQWSGRSLGAVFAQRRNLVRPRFWQMLADIVRFNRLCTAIAREANDVRMTQTIGEFLRAHGFSTAFRDDYLLPMIGCIWSSPTGRMLRFPMATLIRFCHNHGLLQLADRPRWFTVRGGSRNYVRRMLSRIADSRCNTPVRAVRRLDDGVLVHADRGAERFDGVVFACHSDQALAILGADATSSERSVLGAVAYQSNRAVLHTDARVLPSRPAAWSAWNYERSSGEHSRVCLHYLINRLQPLPWQQAVIVSLNPLRPIDPARVYAQIDYEHPVFDMAAIEAQRHVPALQGVRRTWFCGAWCGYGFHEDGLRSGLEVAAAIRRHGWTESPSALPRVA